MVSTDGHRLSRIDRVGELKLAQPLCIPRDGIVELRKLCSAKVRNVDLAVSGTTLYFRASGSDAYYLLNDSLYGPVSTL